MAIQTFSPPVDPTPGTTHGRKLNILEADFGDGYSQPTPNGLNYIRREVALQWDGLSLAQKQAIDSFMFDRGGTEPFLYTVFGETVERKWTCKDWSAVAEAGRWRMAATLVQSFAL